MNLKTFIRPEDFERHPNHNKFILALLANHHVIKVMKGLPVWKSYYAHFVPKTYMYKGYDLKKNLFIFEEKEKRSARLGYDLKQLGFLIRGGHFTPFMIDFDYLRKEFEQHA